MKYHDERSWINVPSNCLIISFANRTNPILHVTEKIFNKNNSIWEFKEHGNIIGFLIRNRPGFKQETYMKFLNPTSLNLFIRRNYWMLKCKISTTLYFYFDYCFVKYFLSTISHFFVVSCACLFWSAVKMPKAISFIHIQSSEFVLYWSFFFVVSAVKFSYCGSRDKLFRVVWRIRKYY